MTQERDIVDELREIQRMNTTLHGAQMAAPAARGRSDGGMNCTMEREIV